MNLADLQQQPEPTERAQIVIVLTQNPQNMVLRFATVKKAEKECAKLMRAWKAFLDKGHAVDRLHYVDGDMFGSTVDLCTVGALTIVNHKVASSFIPR